MKKITDDIHAKHNITAPTLYKWLHMHGAFRRMDKSHVATERKYANVARNSEIVSMYDNGMKIAEISRVYGLTRQRVQQIVRRERPELIRKRRANPNSHESDHASERIQTPTEESELTQ